MEYKCENCGGELHFDPTIGKLKCDFCGSTYDLDDYEHSHDHDHAHDHDHSQDEEHADSSESAQNTAYAKATDDSTDVKEDLRVFACPHCAAEVVTDKDTVATRCVFCGTPMLIEDQLEGNFTPSRVLPFAIDKKQIEDIYEQYIRNKPFYPEEYSKANVIEKIKAVYLPFWLHDLHLCGQLHATGERTSTFTTGKWIVTNHEVYDLFRDGDMAFADIPGIASSKTPRDAMDSLEPFDLSGLEEWNPGYLAGFLASRYDMQDTDVQKKTQKRAENTFNDAMIGTLAGYEGIHITGGEMDCDQSEAEYVLLPSYLLFMDYDEDEDKLIAVNGQTGKIVGNVPVDKKKALRFFLLRFGLLWMILFAAAMFLMIAID